jgi:type II secretory pathway pseudopilin PulG
MKSQSFKRNTAKGFGLLEMILTFILVIGAGAIVFSMFSSAKPTADASNEVNNVTTLATNLQGTYGISNDYSTISSQGAIDAHAVPSTMIDGANIVNGWGGAVTLAEGANKSHYTLTYAAVPAEACTKFVTGAAGFFNEVGVAAAGDVRTQGGAISNALIISGCAGTGPKTVTFGN